MPRIESPAASRPRLPAAAGRARWVAAALLGAGALAALWVTVDRPLLADGAGELAARPGLAAVLVAGYGAAFVLRALGWRVLLGPGAPSALRLTAILHAAVLANHALPVKAGELLRPYLAVRAGVPATAAAGTTVVARALDVTALLALAAALLPLTAGAAGWVLLPLPAALWAAGGAALWLVRRRAAPPLGSAAAALPAPLGRALARAWTWSHGALAPLPWRRIGVAGALTLPSWALEAVVVLVAARALGLDLSPGEAVAVTAFTIVFQTVHLTPGGIGIYEATMTAALGAQGMPGAEALTLAVLTHALKFAYAFLVGGLLSPAAWFGVLTLERVRARADRPRRAGRFEIVAARLWNVLNEGKPFTAVFVTAVVALIACLRAAGWAPGAADGDAGWAALRDHAIGLLAVAPLLAVWYRYDFPLHLRWALWVLLAGALVLLGPQRVDLALWVTAVTCYLLFTVVLWGSVYYHLRIGTPWTNGLRFWRLVLENPDPTSGNFLEQMPKVLLALLVVGAVAAEPGGVPVALAAGGAAAAAAVAVLVHQWWFTWVPPDPLQPTRLRRPRRGGAAGATGGDAPPADAVRRVILVVIDGCRADRLAEAHTPVLDRLAREGLRADDMRTVYPARTVTAFSSMLTGAPPRVHGMRSNFVPSLGVKCESLFAALQAQGRRGRLVGIAHLVDAFGEAVVETVTAVTPNEEIDGLLIGRARAVLERDDPDLLVVQTLSVDQTGHARGSYYPEYLARIEETDRLLGEFLAWCGARGFLDETQVIVTSDHGQGRGIGGHGHLTPPERRVPFIAWGAGVPAGAVIADPRSLLDVAPTVAYALGVAPPAASVGRVLYTADSVVAEGTGPLAIVIPAHNEVERLPQVLARIPRAPLAAQHGGVAVIVVDDGSTDGTARAARAAGADIVVSHPRNRGLGAALRSGLAEARALDARAAVYLDADLEYDPAEISALLAPIAAGEADYVLGSRFRGTRRGHRWWRGAGNRAFTLALAVLAGRRISDGQTGFRAFSARALATAEIVHDYNYAQVLTLDLLRKGMRMTEVPITYRHRDGGRSFIGGAYLWRVPLGMAREVLRD